AAIPDLDGAPPVLPLGDDALEPPVVHGVVLGLHCQALLAGIEARTLGHRPALQDAVELEAEVVRQAPGPVLLDYVRSVLDGAPTPSRLGSQGEVALAAVFAEVASRLRRHSERRSNRRATRSRASALKEGREKTTTKDPSPASKAP